MRDNPDELFDGDRYEATWPMGATKIELIDGHPVFYGSFGQDDVETAGRAFPGRPATIEAWDGQRGNLVLHASGCGPGTCPDWPK